MPFQSRQFGPRRTTEMPSCPSTAALRSVMVRGYWLLATGCWWLLATGYWLLAAGCWLLALVHHAPDASLHVLGDVERSVRPDCEAAGPPHRVARIRERRFSG